jgi:hypothetical protein
VASVEDVMAQKRLATTALHKAKLKSFHKETYCNHYKIMILMCFNFPQHRYYRFVDPVQPKLARSNQSTGQKDHRTTAIPRNPIITVTEHTPTPSPEFMRRQVS